MRVILVMVATVNGKITRGEDPDIYSWTSKEDADFFFSLLNKHELIVMGSNTYEAAREKIILDKKRLRIVLTKTPAKYAQERVEGKLEFTSESPRELVERLEDYGYDTMLLVGGGSLNAAFFKDGLIREVYVTIEPKFFGSGKELVAKGEYSANLQLIDHQVLNDQGTLLLHYHVLQ